MYSVIIQQVICYVCIYTIPTYLRIPICMSLSTQSGQPNSCLTIVIAEGGQVISYDFDSGHCRRTDEGEQVLVQPPQSCAKDQAKYREEIVGSYPIEHFWDTLEPRLLG